MTFWGTLVANVVNRNVSNKFVGVIKEGSLGRGSSIDFLAIIYDCKQFNKQKYVILVIIVVDFYFFEYFREIVNTYGIFAATVINFRKLSYTHSTVDRPPGYKTLKYTLDKWQLYRLILVSVKLRLYC